MSKIVEIARELPSLTPEEKARLLQLIVRDLARSFPGIEATPNVCGGEPCIIRTRIPVWVLEQLRRQGLNESDILRNYPTLRVDDLANAWAYVSSHLDEIERHIHANEEE